MQSAFQENNQNNNSIMKNKIIPESNQQSRKRPRILTILSLVVCMGSFFHLFKFIQILINLQVLRTLPITVSLVYLAVVGFIWSIAGLFLTWSLWTGKPWSQRAGLVLSLAYMIFFWIDLLWIAEPEVLQTRWLINLILTAFGLPAIILILNLKSSRDYFNGNPAKID